MHQYQNEHFVYFHSNPQRDLLLLYCLFVNHWYNFLCGTEKYAAALVLAVDGTVGQLSDLSNNIIGVSYNVSGTKATAPDGTVYWVFAAQVKLAA